MNIYTNNEFKGHWPVGTAAVVWAETPEQAADLLNWDLRAVGLEGDALPSEMKIFTPSENVRILCDGNY